jgi:Fe(3+) dicitrate transport protein
VTAFNRGAAYAVAPHALYAFGWRGLTLTPGLRTELIQLKYTDRSTGDSHERFVYALLPGIGAHYAITEELGALAGVYRGFSPPVPGPAPIEGGDEPDSETSINYEAGMRYALGALRAEAIGFFNDYGNLTQVCSISSCGESALDMQFDAGSARIYGVEVFASHDVPVGPVKLPLSLTYTFTRATFQESFMSENPIWGNVAKGDFVPYVPAHQTRISAGVEGKPAGGAVAFTYVSALREEASKGPLDDVLATDDQYLLDLSAWYKVWGPFTLYGTVQNLLDSAFVVSHRPFGARPNAPRWIHAGVKASF